MKTLVAILSLLTIFVLNTAKASLLHKQYICQSVEQSQESYRISERLIPAGEMLPAFSHEWTLEIDSHGELVSHGLDVAEYADNSSDVQVLKGEGYTAQVGDMKAQLFLNDELVANCMVFDYRPFGICTKDINRFGYPSVCNCEKTHIYNSVSGFCEVESSLATL